MSGEERRTLRELIDRAVRERVAAENSRLVGKGNRGLAPALCSGCAMPWSDWTPGCGVCWDRHRNWGRKRSRYPFAGGYDELLGRRVRLLSERLQIDQSRDWGRARQAA